ncbi:hypothetical protein GC093_29765 [Paenibacillus sp. LMG 31456]|uniref:Uncharacterized protein n=1 Tax=Paenibacillus foliorum TaxID=2654974 RepID=A0A972K5T1_9BACL|nr:hypothetical protein [Paenibacillus foliorum]NOU97387.1 hypothetical protein [Paenibacillus foliorum]
MTQATRVTQLRCEYMTNPFGIDVKKPRLSWRLSTDRRGTRQIAYQVRVAYTEKNLIHESNLVWDLGKVLDGVIRENFLIFGKGGRSRALRAVE